MKRPGIVVASFAVGCAALCILDAGCGPGGPPTADVTGTVTHNGEPVTNATVTFYPDSGRPATGITDASGKFTIATEAGHHKVAIIPFMEVDPEAVAGDPDAVDSGAESTPLPFPAKYQDAETSQFTADVQMGQDNTVTFEMSD
ncbi:MAG TPA: carboxypeptidase-like regulatory domain-containing protein [Pirellulaceae bacterium]|nr:carboxypeptidase-like regulatory domain-containing protein [Pirellulaceae bacterium]